MSRYIGLGKETTFGTAVTATKYVDVMDADIGSDYDRLVQEGVADRGGFRKSEIAFKRGLRGWNMFCEPQNGLTRVLELLFGQGTNTQVGITPAWDHDYTPLATGNKPAATMRKGFDTDELVMPGRMVESAAFRFEVGAYVTARVETMGQFEQATLAALATPTFSAKKAFVGRKVTAQIDAASVDVRSVEVNIANQFDDDDGVLGSDTYSRALKDTRLQVEGTIAWQDFQTAQRTKFVNKTPSSLKLLATGALIGAGPEQDEFEIVCDEVEYTELTWPMSGRDVRRMETPFQALIDPTTGFAVEARVRNEETTIV